MIKPCSLKNDKYYSIIDIFSHLFAFKILMSIATSLDFYNDLLLAVVALLADFEGGELSLLFLYRFFVFNCLMNFLMSGYPLVKGSFMTI